MKHAFHLVATFMIMMAGCAKEEPIKAPEAEPFPLEGIYVNDLFEAWEIRRESGALVAEMYSRTSMYEDVFKVDASFKNGTYLLRLYRSNRGLECLVYEDDNKVFLDYERLPRGRGVKQIREFIKTDSTSLDKSDFEQISGIANWKKGAIYAGGDTVFILVPRYPTIDVARVTVDRSFKVKNISLGYLDFPSDKLMIRLPDGDIEYASTYESKRILDLFDGSEVVLPIVGDSLCRVVLEQANVQVKEGSVGHESLVKLLRSSRYCVFNKQFYLFSDDGLIDSGPREGAGCNGEDSVQAIFDEASQTATVTLTAIMRNDTGVTTDYTIEVEYR